MIIMIIFATIIILILGYLLKKAIDNDEGVSAPLLALTIALFITFAIAAIGTIHFLRNQRYIEPDDTEIETSFKELYTKHLKS